MTRREREAAAFKERQAQRVKLAKQARRLRREDALYHHARLVDETDRDIAGEFGADRDIAGEFGADQ